MKLFTVPILNDGLKETKENFRITLSNPTGGGVLGAQKTATVTILDNDPGVEFVTAKYYIHEDEGALRVTVRRGNDLALGLFTVDYATVDGTALAGQDYVATNGTLAFAAGELSRSFEVPISNTDHFTFGNHVVFNHYPLGTNREAARTINAYALSFFNKWLKGQDDRLHEGPSPDFPRVINFRKK